MSLDHRPEPIRGREIGHTLGQQDRTAGGQPADQLPGPHDPAQVGDPMQHVVGVHIGLVGRFLRDLDQEPAVHVDRPLRPPGCARRVHDHHRGLGIEGFARTLGRLARDELVPVDVSGIGGYARARGRSTRPGDDQVTDARAGVGGLAGDRLELDRLALAEGDVGGDECHGLAVIEPHGDGPRAETREDGDRDRADLGAGQERDDGLGHHGEEQPDAVAPADPQPPHRAGQPAGLGVQLGIGQRAHRAVFALPDHGGVVSARRKRVTIDALVSQVDRPSDEPSAPGDPAVGVQQGVGRPEELDVQILERGAPEPFDVADAARDQIVVVGDPVTPHEASDVGPLDDVRRRTPHVAPRHGVSDRSACLNGCRTTLTV